MTNPSPTTTVFSTGPYTPVYGQAAERNGERVHLTHADLLAATITQADDPRLAITARETQRYTHQTTAGLEAIALRVTEEGEGNKRGKEDARVVAALHTARTTPPEEMGVDAQYGAAGRLAKALETVGLHLHHEGTVHANPQDVDKARHLLAIAAVAHTAGAKGAATQGYSHHYPSVVEAASFQDRPIGLVVADLAQHGVLKANDPRIAIAQAPTRLDIPEALEAVAPQRPGGTTKAHPTGEALTETILTQGYVRARRAEANAMSILGTTKGDPATLEQRHAEARTMLAGAFALADHRREALHAQREQPTATPTRRIQQTNESR